MLLATALLLFLCLVATGNFHVNTGYNDLSFGVYESALQGLSAYHDPGIWTLGCIELASLLLMPAIATVVRNWSPARLRISLLPWWVLCASTLPATYLWLDSLRNGGSLKYKRRKYPAVPHAHTDTDLYRRIGGARPIDLASRCWRSQIDTLPKTPLAGWNAHMVA